LNKTALKIKPGFRRGVKIGNAKDRVVKALISRLGANPRIQSVGESVAADAMGHVYRAETNGMRTRKFIKK
jgi:hypothetical protein